MGCLLSIACCQWATPEKTQSICMMCKYCQCKWQNPDPRSILQHMCMPAQDRHTAAAGRLQHGCHVAPWTESEGCTALKTVCNT